MKARIKAGRYSHEGSLLDTLYRDEETKEYIVVLNPNKHRQRVPLCDGQ